MSRKSQYLQIRVTPEQKAVIQGAARRAGQGMSAFVLARLLPPAGRQFDKLLQDLAEGKRPSYTLAELNDLLTQLAPGGFAETVAHPPPPALLPYLRNYVAAMVELAAHQKGVAPPDWVTGIEPLEEPRFVEPLAGLRLHLLASAPIPFRRRNIFVDSTIGDRV